MTVVCSLFCCGRALRLGLLSQDMIEMYDPALMFTIPRLAIVRYADSVAFVQKFSSKNTKFWAGNTQFGGMWGQKFTSLSTHISVGSCI